jgi:hypothetical protein
LSGVTDVTLKSSTRNSPAFEAPFGDPAVNHADAPGLAARPPTGPKLKMAADQHVYRQTWPLRCVRVDSGAFDSGTNTLLPQLLKRRWRDPNNSVAPASALPSSPACSLEAKAREAEEALEDQRASFLEAFGCPVRAFRHTSQAQFYVSMSRARAAMYLYTDSKVALREAVCRPSARLSPWNLLEGSAREKALVRETQQSPKWRLPVPTMELPTQERGLGYERG